MIFKVMVSSFLFGSVVSSCPSGWVDTLGWVIGGGSFTLHSPCLFRASLIFVVGWHCHCALSSRFIRSFIVPSFALMMVLHLVQCHSLDGFINPPSDPTQEYNSTERFKNCFVFIGAHRSLLAYAYGRQELQQQQQC